MLQKNIIENAYTAIIELADNCDLDDISTCASLYHLARFIRAEIRDFNSNDKQFDKMYDTVNINSARLKKLADIKTITDVETERSINIPIEFANIHLSINWLICKALREKSAENYVHLYNIAALYAQKLSCVTDKSVSPLIYEIRRDIRWLDAKINPDKKISEGDDFYAYYYNHQ
ncbi:MAG: hypothetical protein NC192_12005 [Muribaculaceae bacterium]|nr:hypothetical protein [Muribaculaceae bacterium]